MIGRTNAGGGGLANAYAVIAATYPAGAACTCTNGTKTLKAKDTSGSWLFMIPQAGTWTVSYSADGKSDSRAIEITDYGQVEKAAFRIPSAYQEVEYIEGTGTQYIKVSEMPDNTSELIWDIYYEQYKYVSENKYCRIGTWGDRTTFGFQAENDGKINVFLKDTWGDGLGTTSVSPATGWHRISVSFIDNFTSVDSVKNNGSFSSVNFGAGETAFGFGILGPLWAQWAQGGTPSTFLRCKEFIWKKNRVEAMHLIPCYRITDKAAGMYDTVKNKFYTNNGTGTFVVGGDVQ